MSRGSPQEDPLSSRYATSAGQQRHDLQSGDQRRDHLCGDLAKTSAGLVERLWVGKSESVFLWTPHVPLQK